MGRPTQTKELGQRIKEARVAKGMTQLALAKGAGLRLGDVGRLEIGYYARPNPATLARIARVLKVDVEEFYDLVAYEAPALPVYLRSKYRRLPGCRRT